MGCPIPPPSIILFQSLILHVYRILWRVTSGVIIVLLSAVNHGVLWEVVLFYSSTIGRTRYTDIIWKALLHLAVPLTAMISSGIGLTQAAGQQAPSSGPRARISAAYDALQTGFHTSITLTMGLSPFLFALHELVQKLRVESVRRHIAWSIFWHWYFVFGNNWFQQDVLEAWERQLSQKLTPGERLQTFVICVNNGLRMEVPCLPNLDDKGLLAHLYYFYSFAKADGAPLSGLSVRSLGRVEISQVNFLVHIPMYTFGP